MLEIISRVVDGRAAGWESSDTSPTCDSFPSELITMSIEWLGEFGDVHGSRPKLEFLRGLWMKLRCDWQR